MVGDGIGYFAVKLKNIVAQSADIKFVFFVTFQYY